jgi:hypothetical protein
MANWVYIENNQIVEYHDLLPKNWRHVSGLDMSANDLNFLKSLGWYKVIKNHQSYDNNVHKLLGFLYTIEEDHVTETSNLQLITQEEKDQALYFEKINFFSYLREQRNLLLASCDWTQLHDVINSHSEEWNNSWKEYRQKLRDLPLLFTDNIGEINWPVPPQNAT